MVLYMDMDGLLLVATGLGHMEQEEGLEPHYVKGEECLENLKDLQRYLRRDNPVTRDVFYQLGQWNIVQQDLVPIITTYRHDGDLVLNAIKVLVFLTLPVSPVSENANKQYESLQRFKSALLDGDVLAITVALLEKPLENIESGRAGEDDWKLVQLIITLFRNLLAIPDRAPGQFSSDAHLGYMRDELIAMYTKESILDLILSLVQCFAETHSPLLKDSMLFLEIFYYIFKGQKASAIFSSKPLEGSGRSRKKKEAYSGISIMKEILNREKGKLGQKGPYRHSTFGGTYLRKNLAGERSLVAANPFQTRLDDMPCSMHVKRKPLAKEEYVRPSSYSICLLLKDFTEQLLSSGYNGTQSERWTKEDTVSTQSRPSRTIDLGRV